MPIRLAYEPITIGDTIQVIDGPDAGAEFVVEFVTASGTVGVRTRSGELVGFPRPQITKTK